MSRASGVSEKGTHKRSLCRSNPIFPSVLAGECGNTVFTVTYVESYRQRTAFVVFIAWLSPRFSFFGMNT